MRPDASARNRASPASPLPVERFFQFSLLGLLASGYLAVAGSAYLDVPTMILTGGGILLRALLVGGLVRLNLSERTATIAAVAYAAFFPIDYFFLSHDFLSSTVHLVFFLAVMKILTASTNRDNFYIAVIAFLELLAAAILSINFTFFLCLALFLLFAIAALTSGEIRRAMRRAPTTARAGLKHFHSRLAILGGVDRAGNPDAHGGYVLPAAAHRRRGSFPFDLAPHPGGRLLRTCHPGRNRGV